jgi:hypothetical protein
MQLAYAHNKIQIIILAFSIFTLALFVSSLHGKVVQTIGGYQVNYPQGKLEGSYPVW